LIFIRIMKTTLQKDRLLTASSIDHTLAFQISLA
jgi:hypothetical protein